MSNAKGSGKDNKLTQPQKVTAQTRSEANAVSTQNYRTLVQKAVAMPASAVRAAMASTIAGAAAARVAYDVLSRLLNLVETGVVLDKALLKTTKAALQTAHAGDTILYRNIGKVIAQITTLNDVLTRIVSYKRTYTEVARSTDLPAKTLTKAPRQDTAKSQDVRVKTIGKNKSDTLTFSDNFSRVITYRRTPADVLNSVDVKKFTLTKRPADIASGSDAKATTLSKPKAETINLAELKKLNLGKFFTEISRASDSDKITFTKRVSDFVSAIHSAHVDLGFTNSEVNLSTVSDTLTRLTNFVRTYQDIARGADVAKRTFSKPRTETPRATDRLSRLVSFGRSRPETAKSADAFSRLISFNRTYTDVAKGADSPAKYLTKSPFLDTYKAVDASRKTLSKRPADTSRAGDSFSRLIQFNRTFNSTATSTTSVDVFSSVKNYNRLRTETARSTDNFTKVVTFRRTRPETAKAADVFSKIVTYNRSRVDTSRATDVFLKVVTYNRSRVDTSRATDVFLKVVTYRRLPADTSRAIDFITAKTITKRLNELVRVSDVFVISGYTHPGSLPPADAQRARDYFRRLVSFIRSYSDTAKAQDTRKNTYTKVGGSTYSIWSDFNELTVDYDTTQTYDPRKLEIIQPADAVGKFYSKIANKIGTYYYDAYPITDFNELTFTQPKVAASSVTTPVVNLYSYGQNIIWSNLSQDVLKIAVGNMTGDAYLRDLLNIVVDGYALADINQTGSVTSADALSFLKLELYYNNPSYAGLTTAEKARADNYIVPYLYDELYPALVLGFPGPPTTFNTATVIRLFRTGLTGISPPGEIFNPPFAVTTYVTTTTPATFDQDQLFTYTDSYQADTERALISDVVSKIARFVRSPADTASTSDTTGRYIARTVGDNKSNVFNDFNELLYTNEFYSADGGINAAVIVQVVPPSRPSGTPTYSAVIDYYGPLYYNYGAQFTVGQQLGVETGIGTVCTFTVASIFGAGAIDQISNVAGTPNRTLTQSATFTDFADLTFGTTADQDLVQYDARVYTYPSQVTLSVGPKQWETKRNVLGQDLLFTLTPKTDGDTTKSLDSSSKFISKEARRYLPQGVFEDFAELTFGLGGLDQELSQYLNRFWPESVSTLDIASRATLGPIKRNRDTLTVPDTKIVKVSKPSADTTAFSDNIRSATTGLGISKSVGEWANRSWRDYAEISGLAFSTFAEMPIDYEGRFELLIIPDTLTRSIVKPLHFEYNVWRDFNELSFGTSRDEELVFTWYRDDTSDITRMMDRTINQVSKGLIEILTIPETFPKTVSKGVGNTTQNDALINNPEYIPYLSWFDELLTPQYPDYKIDRVTVSETRGNYITKTILGPGPINRFIDTNIDTVSFDESSLTFGYIGSTNNTFPDVKFVNYFDELVTTEFEEAYRTPYGSDSGFATDAFSKLVTFRRLFNEDVRANDYFLLSKNNEALTNEYLPVISKTASAGDTIRSATYGFILSKQVGDVKSAISLWSDFVELQIDYELAQYYDDPQGSRIDTGKSLDFASRQFSKQGGRVYSILNVFDEDIYYDAYLQNTFATDYVTENIFAGDVSTRIIQPNKSEVMQLSETIGKFIEKYGIGESVIEELTTYSPLYLEYLSDIEESLFVNGRYIARIGPPPRRTDIARGVDTNAKKYDKQAGMSPVLKWYSNFEYLYYDETNVTEGTRQDRENGFPQTVFRNYLDAEIWGDVLEDFYVTSIRTENLSVIDQIYIKCLWGRNLPRIALAQDAVGKQLDKPKSETVKSADKAPLTVTKPAGTMFTVWTDYNELVVGQDLDQNYDDIRLEYLIAIENFVKVYSKSLSETSKAADVRVKSISKPISETQLARETLGKYFTKPEVGNSTLTAYYDTNEIYSFDETLFSYGLTRTTRFDIARPADAIGKNYNVKAGYYRTNIWSDYLDLEFNNDLANYYPPYVTEFMVSVDAATKRLNKGRTELPRATDAGFVRKFDSGAYVIDTSPYFAEDYTSDGVTISTF
jgi:hypothetical protein